MVSVIILVAILKCCHGTNQVLQKCFLFEEIYREDFGVVKRLSNKHIMENLKATQKLTKGLNELVNVLITLISVWKINGLNLCFLGIRKTFPSNYDSKLAKVYFINKLKHLSFLSDPFRDWKLLRFQVTLSDKSGGLSH